MLETVTDIAITALKWVATAVICLFMIVRYDLFIKGVIYLGLGIAVTAGFLFAVAPFLAATSIILVPVGVLVVIVLPLWLVFKR